MVLSGMIQSRAATIGTILLAVFFIGMNPPVIGFFNRATTVAGFGLLYLWLVVMAIYVSVVIGWLAYTGAYALTEDQVPPELRKKEDIVTTVDDEANPKGGDQ